MKGVELDKNQVVFSGEHCARGRDFHGFFYKLCARGFWPGTGVLLGCHSVPAGRGQVRGDEEMRVVGKETRMEGGMDG